MTRKNLNNLPWSMGKLMSLRQKHIDYWADREHAPAWMKRARAGSQRISIDEIVSPDIQPFENVSIKLCGYLKLFRWHGWTMGSIMRKYIWENLSQFSPNQRDRGRAYLIKWAGRVHERKQR